MAFTDRLANRGSISTGFTIENSIYLDGNVPDEMYFTTDNASSDHDKGTFSFWWKRGERGHISPMQINEFAGPYHSGMYWQMGTGNLADRLYMSHKDNDNSWTSWMRQFRDHNAWYHFCITVDTTEGTADNRIKLCINGGDPEGFNTLDSYNTPPGQNDAHFWFDTGREMRVGGVGSGDCYYADYHYVDGQALQPESFGEIDEDSGIWKPKEYTGTYGNNGFHLEFKQTGTSANASGIGADTSGNGHHMTLTGVDATNIAEDTPTNNFCLWDSNETLFSSSADDSPVIKGGGTVSARGSGTGWVIQPANMAMSQGKWYMEHEISNDNTQCFYGVTPVITFNDYDYVNSYHGAYTSAFGNTGVGYYASGENVYHWNESNVNTNTASTATTAGDILSVAVDLDNNKVHFAVNGSWTNSSDPANNTNGFNILDVDHFFSMTTNNPNQTHKANFGGYTAYTISSAASDADGYGKFEYAPPSGFYALCTKNLAEYG